MRAIRDRILAAIGTGGLAANGLAGCGGALTAGTASDAMADAIANGMIAADGAVPAAANADAYPEARGDIIGITDGSTVMEGAVTNGVVDTGDGTSPSDAAPLAETAADAGTDSAVSCTCSMLYGPCGDANPCGCCPGGGGLRCSGGNTCLVTVRRPFLVGASLRSARAVARADWTRALSPPSRTLVGRSRRARANVARRPGRIDGARRMRRRDSGRGACV
jgi:hypothetical protein